MVFSSAGIGVPIMLAYVYGVVPISLCRSGGCGVSAGNGKGVRIEFDDENDINVGGTNAAVGKKKVSFPVNWGFVTLIQWPQIPRMQRVVALRSCSAVLYCSTCPFGHRAKQSQSSCVFVLLLTQH